MTKNPNISKHSLDLTLAKLEGIGPRIRAAADEISSQRRLPADLVAAFRAAGLHRLFLPRELGGLEARPAQVVRLVSALAAADGSAGWCAAIAAGAGYFGGILPRDGAELIFADPDTALAAVFEPRGTAESVDDELRLSGRWAFASTCLHADFIGFAAIFPTLGAAPRLAFVPRASVQIHDTWQVAGLRGTGSHDCSLERVPVDPRLMCALGDVSWSDAPLWRLPTMTALGPLMAAAPLGMARGAIDDLMQRVSQSAASDRRFVDDEQNLAELATCDAALRAAEALLLSMCDEAWFVVERGAMPLALLRAQVFMACQHALDTAVAVASSAHRLAGSAGVYDGNRVLRIMQDTHTTRQHAYFARRHRPNITRALAGLKGSSQALL
jgi:alkylation response protein AidB-like acyl-CoA dehydrogenase